MNIKSRLIAMNFLEFFIWGSWLISLGGYMFSVLHATGAQIGLTYGTMGLASLFMPALMGVIADRWINAEKVLGFCHLVGAGLLFWASKVQDPSMMYWVILFNSMFFMPTIALNNTVSYITLEKNGFDIVKTFPPIRVWGTIGFIVAVWVVDLFGWTLTSSQFIVSASASVLLAIYSFSMPACIPAKRDKKLSWSESFGLDALVLFKRKKMVIFFLFAMLLGAALQITNAFGKPFLDDFGSIAAYKDSFGVKHSNILISISQISETLFILAIPFFLKRFGIKTVMLISIIAWVFRFGLFGIGNPGDGLWLLVLSMIIYGMAFDFFNISGSLFVEREAEPKIRASAQGLFMVLTNGVGAYLGGWISGLVVDYFTVDGIRNWQNIWFTFAAYALVLAIVFPFVFKYKHQREKDIVPNLVH
ncbi:MAG: nucleoside permease [Bacteroidetes bacterium]|nr:nucleoside permease [Bacteroidota bacterium]MBU1371633.1 nucleoside permease [Bacteroidota bacterium]MBU1486209.1 nucleoside permease [Bacteroidota bacterium]MBU1761719.1 nucleoside permease [Bacteroidota bacterium]MBU2269469.1 nucleoside permease [Bacteroidota bacterium]